ncbi:MAG: neutral/alkaline non-lysosomal ceramidase N-terminal domain-containing protein [Verrucomicrobia bacterium]|nr:neutral/alkaline non-lysosomal ceramidase N-terminal domain-containing protein [Verrucomicrobiota bacterium]
MKIIRFGGFLLASALLVIPAAVAAEKPEALRWKAGAAAADITPEGPVWMAGYGNRTKPSETVAQRIFAKALALENALNSRVVIVTLDLSEVPLQMREAVERQVGERYGLPPGAILPNCSHTHSGPSTTDWGVRFIRGELADPLYIEKAAAYGKMVEGKIVEAIGEAISRSSPANLHYTRARAGFAMNRRLRNGHVIQNSPNPEGPVDHDVPVLRVTAPDGSLKAILFGYACHNTGSGTYAINGDYAGYAQAYLEQAHPGTVALFMLGAGGDQNPYPRGTLELVAQHGRTLANAVEAALSVTVQRPVNGPLRSAIGYATIDYAVPSRAELELQTRSRNNAEKARGASLLKKLEADGKLSASYLCPVQVVQFGVDLTLIAIGGETTVDYSLRLKQELGHGPAAVWVAGYSNDVFGYMGSRRVIIEGGYEGYSSNVSYGDRHPGPFTTTTEERVVEKVYELIRAINH